MAATFYLKLIPPRPTFAADMTEAEMDLMRQHAAYMGRHFEAGRVLIYGPVFAQSGSFGMGVLQVEGEAEARRIMESDPTILAGLNTYEIWPMRLGGAQAAQG